MVTIRRFPKEAMTVEKLIAYGSITPEVAQVLELLVRVPGTTSSSAAAPAPAKPRFSNALVQLHPPG